MEVLSMYEALGKEFDTFCLLQPTSPLRSTEDIKSAYQLFEEKKAKFVVSLVELEHPLAWCGTLVDGNSLDGFFNRTDKAIRQANKTYYRPNGAIYICDVSEFKKDQFVYRDKSFAYIMPRERSIDIDSELDFLFASFLLTTNGMD